jgi:hypothetical protein
MGKISNDVEMRDVISTLDAYTQRLLGARFVGSVKELTGNPDLLRAIDTAMDPDLPASVQEAAYHTAKGIAVATYTACGHDADWLAQAEHFVAAASAAALAPVSAGSAQGAAWKAAMQARIARTCAMIESADDRVANEAARQYAIVEEFLG